VVSGNTNPYFRLLVPIGTERHAHLLQTKRIITEEKPSDHAVSNRQIPLPRLCAPSCTVNDRRYTQQFGQMTNKDNRQTPFTELDVAGTRAVIQEFLDDCSKLTKGALPCLKADFDAVTDEVIQVICKWLQFQWVYNLSKKDRDGFLAKWKWALPCPEDVDDSNDESGDSEDDDSDEAMDNQASSSSSPPEDRCKRARISE
jgi:hypothetical protein